LLKRDRKEKNGLASGLPPKQALINTPHILFEPHIPSPTNGEEDEVGFYPIMSRKWVIG